MHVGHGNSTIEDRVEFSIEHTEEELAMFEALLCAERTVEDATTPVCSRIKVSLDLDRDESQVARSGIGHLGIVEEMNESGDGVFEEVTADGTQLELTCISLGIFDATVKSAERGGEVAKQLGADGWCRFAMVKVLAEDAVDAIFDLGNVGGEVDKEVIPVHRDAVISKSSIDATLLLSSSFNVGLGHRSGCANRDPGHNQL